MSYCVDAVSCCRRISKKAESAGVVFSDDLDMSEFEIKLPNFAPKVVRPERLHEEEKKIFAYYAQILQPIPASVRVVQTRMRRFQEKIADRDKGMPDLTTEHERLVNQVDKLYMHFIDSAKRARKVIALKVSGAGCWVPCFSQTAVNTTSSLLGFKGA